MLLLSLIYSFMGLGEEAYQTAIEGTRRGEELKSPFITAVGYMRQGHALMLSGMENSHTKNFPLAFTQFEKSIDISRTLAIPRLLVEADWGLCRAYGYSGNLALAQAHAQEAIELATQAGDEWVASLTCLAMGASLSLDARYEAAEEWLHRAVFGFQECSDPFGSTAARLWLGFGFFKQKQATRLERILPEVLSTCKSGGYGFLFTRPSLLGTSEESLFIPLLITARKNNWEASYATQLLEEMGLDGIEEHPGYRLRVQTLNGFQVWRGNEQIQTNGWRREKSKHLFQLLLTYRSTALDRDQLCEYLWPEANPSVAQRNFKAALNTLYQVLEPERKPGKISAFIMRDGTTYRLRPSADIWLDVGDFTDAARSALSASPPNLGLFQRAVSLYAGEYLPETLYESWAAVKREHLSALFLETADQLAEMQLKQKRYAEVIELCQRILAEDNCWERAYRYLMLAYEQLGDHGQVGRTYQRCLQVLAEELDVLPSEETKTLFKKITGQHLVD